jgi:hypothetical protein
MDLSFFESMTKAEAKLYLKHYLMEVGEGVQELIEQARNDGITADFTIPSISPVFRWTLPRLHVVPVEPNPSVPEWIRESSSYKEGLFVFDEPSAIMVGRASFYWGESFIRSYPGLSWAVGTGGVDKNMPVVIGLRNRDKMPPLLIADNLFGGLIKGHDTFSDIDSCAQLWVSHVLGT